jgi:hypothetical protein
MNAGTSKAVDQILAFSVDIPDWRVLQCPSWSFVLTSAWASGAFADRLRILQKRLGKIQEQI